MNDQYTMPEEHVSILSTLTGVRHGEPLPPVIVETYWEMKRCYDRVSAYVSERELAMLAWQCGFGHKLGEEGRINVRQLFSNKELAYGSEVEARYRGEWRLCKIIGLAGKADVMVDINGDERRLNGAHVRLPQPAEATV